MTQSCKSGRLKVSLGFCEILIRIDLIHCFGVEFAKKLWCINNLIYMYMVFMNSSLKNPSKLPCLSYWFVSSCVVGILSLFLVLFSWRLKWAFLIKICLLSAVVIVVDIVIVNFSHIHFLLQNHWTNFIQTWHKASLGNEDSSLFKWRAQPFSKEIFTK